MYADDNICGCCGAILCICSKCVYEPDHEEWHLMVMEEVYNPNKDNQDETSNNGT